MSHRTRQQDVPLVTEAKRPMSEDIAYRERRYLVMMGIRVLCFVIAIVLFVSHAGWLAAIPAVGAIIIPYFAVVFANGGREPSSTRGFRPYEPDLPEPYSGSSQSASSPTGKSSPPADSTIPRSGRDSNSEWHTGSHQDR